MQAITRSPLPSVTTDWKASLALSSSRGPSGSRLAGPSPSLPPLSLIRNDPLQHLGQVQHGPIADQSLDLRDIRDPTRHVLETGLVGLFIGHKEDVRAAAGHSLHERREVVDRNLLRMPDVEDLAVGLRMLDQGKHGADDVAHPGEGAALGAVAVDWDGLTRQGEADEARHHHAVLPRLAGADGVEEPD